MNLLFITFDLGKIGEDGVMVALVGYIVVFCVLFLLYLVFSTLSKVLLYQAKKKCKDKGRDDCANAKDFTPSGDVNAAISMALHMYFNEMHDEESGVLTVKRIARRYSPWSSKIYNVMGNAPRR